MYSRSDRSCRLSMSWALHWFHLKSLCHLDCGGAVYYQVLTKCPHKWQSFSLSFRLLCPFQCENMSYLWNNYSISLYIFTGENKKQHYLLGWVKTRKKKIVQELCMQEKITTLQHCQHYLLGWVKKRITTTTKKKTKPNQPNKKAQELRMREEIATLQYCFGATTVSPNHRWTQSTNSKIQISTLKNVISAISVYQFSISEKKNLSSLLMR